jgi:hypothetical protein
LPIAHIEEQHTLSTHMVEVQSVPIMHGSPRPHFALQGPPHADPAHWHAPLPSQGPPTLLHAALGSPFVTGAQVPSALPVSAITHESQPPHVLWQQTLAS